MGHATPPLGRSRRDGTPASGTAVSGVPRAHGLDELRPGHVAVTGTKAGAKAPVALAPAREQMKK